MTQVSVIRPPEHSLNCRWIGYHKVEYDIQYLRLLMFSAVQGSMLYLHELQLVFCGHQTGAEATE